MTKLQKFDVLDRFTGAVKFTAKIDCANDTPRRVKLGLAVKWAVENRASLNRANLDGARLVRASFNGASLDWASLVGANLVGARLVGANLDGARLVRASLNGANLDGARLVRASLNGASLVGARLVGANLNRANLNWARLDGARLDGADLDGARLDGASLNGANLDGASGINAWVKGIQIETYPITYTSDILQIGCERHGIEDWRGFSDARILEMDGKMALTFWRKYKDWIFQTIDLCPARPMKETS